MSTQIIYGTVDAKGEKISGNSFSSTNEASGRYRVRFEPPFASPPAVTTSQVFAGVHNNGGDSRDNALVITIEKDKVRIRTGNADGGTEDRSFSFIAVGPAG